MTPAPWGRSHQQEYWTGCLWGIFVVLPIAFVVLYGAVQIIVLIVLGHTVR